MKKAILVISILTLSFIIICSQRESSNSTSDNKINNIKEIIVSKDNKCKLDKTFYAKGKNNKFYTSCLTEIKVKFSDNSLLDLKKALNERKIDLNDLINLNDEKNAFENTNIYKINNLSFLVCENNEIILGDYDSLIKHDYCEAAIDESV